MTTLITTTILNALGTSERPDIVAGVVTHFNHYAPDYSIDTDLEVAHFFAQAAVETDDFHTLVEYASGHAYEWRHDLGNNQSGDGPRYKGRGIFQVTGRANYRTFGRKIGVDLEAQPELAADPQYSVLLALEYWKDRDLGRWAINDNVEEVTRRINGGYNHLTERKDYLRKMKALLKGDIVFGISDEIVKPYQRALVAQGYQLTPDGSFGPRTLAAVEDFQQKKGLPVTGDLDAYTRRMLVS